MFFDNYRFLCLRSGKTPNGVAKELGIPSASVSQWKNGSTPRPETLNKIAVYFECSVETLLNGTKEKPAPTNGDGLLSAALSMYYPDFVLRTTMPQKTHHEIEIPDMDEISALLQASAGTKMEVPLLLAVWLGLRESEIRGLTWDCIEGDYLHVKQAIVDGENGPVLKGTKTYSGDRCIRLPEHIKEVLEKQPKIGRHIVTLSGHAMYNRLSRMSEKLGLPHRRFHDLRHTAASVAMSLGVPNTYTQKRMGHATDHMLKTVYLHTMRSKEDEYADKIDKTYNDLLHTDLHAKSEGG